MVVGVSGLLVWNVEDWYAIGGVVGDRVVPSIVEGAVIGVKRCAGGGPVGSGGCRIGGGAPYCVAHGGICCKTGCSCGFAVKVVCGWAEAAVKVGWLEPMQ